MTTDDREVLLIVDVQNDFCPGGALAVPEGDAIVPAINRLAHSFASSHPGKLPFDTIEVSYGAQILWPDHCVQGTSGAAFHPRLDVPHPELILRKGFRKSIDSYSAFCENDRRTATGLAGYLRERGFRRITLCGLATDFCVAFSAIDGRGAGFEVAVVTSACRGIDNNGSLDRALRSMVDAGVRVHAE
jgi:nicotinamidase/pyrazinamidase